MAAADDLLCPAGWRARDPGYRWSVVWRRGRNGAHLDADPLGLAAALRLRCYSAGVDVGRDPDAVLDVLLRLVGARRLKVEVETFPPAPAPAPPAPPRPTALPPRPSAPRRRKAVPAAVVVAVVVACPACLRQRPLWPGMWCADCGWTGYVIEPPAST